ncbi:MAG: hypothetical protein ACRC8S_10055 [Fimbriiglobus sp.]
MKRHRWILAGTACGFAAVITGLALRAQGQDQPSAPVAVPKFYAGKVSPPGPGIFREPKVTPPGGLPPANNLPTFGGNRPVPAMPGAAPSGVQPAGGIPRGNTAVIAGPNGVRTVSASEPTGTPPFFNPPAVKPVAPAPVLGEVPAPPEPKPLPPRVEVPAPAPMMPVVPTTPVAPSPVVSVEPTAPGTLPTLPSQPAAPAVETTPVVTMPTATPRRAPETLPTGQLPSRQVPNVILETICPETVGINQTLTYELVVRNTGTSSVQGVRVEDELPAKCQFLGSEPAAETSGDRLAWSLGQLESGAEKRIKISVRPTEEGDLRSRASVSFAASVEARARVTRPKIAIAMTGPEVIRVGEKVDFQIKLTNSGTGTAGKIRLQAKFTEGLSHPQGQVIEADLENLAAGQSKTLNLTAIAAKSGGQVCTISAIADNSQTEVAKSNVSLVEAMLTIKQTGPQHCLVKAEPVYNIELSNPGTCATDPVQIWAALPAGMELVATTDGGSFLEANRAVGWRLPGLAAGTSKTLSMKLRATAPTEGAIRTVAQAANPMVEAAGVVNVEARQSTTKGLEARTETIVKAEGIPALRFDVVDLEDPIVVGKEATYEIRVVNQGTGACTNVQLVAELAESTSSAGSNGPTAGKVSGQQLVFEPIAQFGVKAEAVYRVRVKGTQPGDYRFRVRLVCDQIRTPTIKEENTRFYKE